MATEKDDWYTQLLTVFEPAPASVGDTLLGQIFGNWIFTAEELAARKAASGGFTHGLEWTGMADVTAISTVLGYSGIFAAGLALIITSYTFLTQMIKGAWEGNFAGGQMNSVWWPIRSLFAFSLIMPLVTIGQGSTATQVATSQIWLMDLARKGSAGADSVAQAYLTNLMSNPISNPRPMDMIKAPQDVLKMAICATTMSKNENKLYPDVLYVLSGAPSTATPIEYDEDKGLPDTFTVDGSNNIILFGKNGVCGSIVFKEARGTQRDIDVLGELRTNIASSMKAPYETLIKDAFSLAYQGVVVQGTENIMSYRDSQAYPVEIMGLGVSYARMIENFNTNTYNAVLAAMTTNKDSLTDLIFGPIKAGGWAALGSAYNLAPKISNLPITSIQQAHELTRPANYVYDCGVVWFNFLADNDTCEIAIDINSLNNELMQVITILRSRSSDRVMEGSGGLTLITACDIDSCDSKKVDESVRTEIASFLLDMFSSYGYGSTSKGELGNDVAIEGKNADEFSGDGDRNHVMDAHPVTTMSSIGTGFLHLKVTLQLAVTALSFTENIINATNETFSASGFGTAAIKTVVVIAIESLEKIIAQLGLAGFVMAYVLPKLPALIWVMMVAGWALTVAEGMFAVPFAVALLTTPEGDGAINTRFEKALSLIAAIFLRPVFNVFGFITSQAIAVPVFHFFNTWYWAFTDLEAASHGTTGLFDIISTVMVYCLFLVVLVKMIFSVMHLLGDQMLNWMTSGVTSAFGPQNIAGEIESGVTGEAGKIGTGMGVDKVAAKHKDMQDKKAKADKK